MLIQYVYEAYILKQALWPYYFILYKANTKGNKLQITLAGLRKSGILRACGF